MVAGGITLSDLGNRISDAKQEAASIQSSNPQAAALMQQFYGVKPGDGALAAYYLDPTKSEQLLQNQAQAANIGGGLEQAGFTQVNQQQLQALAGQGVTPSASAAAKAAAFLPATTHLESGEGTGETVTQQQVVASQLGGPGAAAATLAVSGAANARAAKLQGGGGFGSGSAGQTGAGTASE